MFFEKPVSFSDIKNDHYIIENILWDVMPTDIAEPRIKLNEEGSIVKKTIKGYIFYIETFDKRPSLFLMRHTANGYAETVAEIKEVPEELLIKAIEENKDKEFFGMYPINNDIKDWLKKELGVL